ncbi:hypothetical protein HPB50_001837 [Hyalomma asiaticum]|uniref:Uncharacterized protein n=1 Tax=Hyalomma asiaticum TaxID=266040 RepID=A0ACB7SLK1_HYAAI|nr:hypothetical protein HPB50_001837 [Hyalomma asiaticum]
MEAEELEAASWDPELTEAMNALGATGATYNYINIDAAIMTSECHSIAKIVANKVANADCDDDNEHKRNSQELAKTFIGSSFGEVIAAMDFLHSMSHTLCGALQASKKIVTAVAYKIIACTKNLDERAKLLISPKEFYGSSVQYGIRMEPTAQASFEREHNTSVSLHGLVVCPEEPWLACSPDGIFRTQDGQTALLEIKCLYSRRNGRLKEAPPLPYLEKDEQLKKHSYYAQVQVSLYVLQLRECWFYVYTPKDTMTLRIARDEDYLAEAIPKLRNFYFVHYLPNLARMNF